MSRDRPLNVLWVSFEDTNPFYGCYGDPVAATPNLDRLAAEGCRYTHAFATAGVCAPARSAVITGMYPTSIGTHHMRTAHTHIDAPELPTPYSAVIPHYVKCFPEYLRAAGYYCTNNVKTDYQFESPFTAWDELSNTAHWRNRPDPEQPFFAVFNLQETHESGMWPENCQTLTVDPEDVRLPPYFPDTPKVREAMARMYTHIENNDTRLGDLLQQLEEDGVAENTVVMHWSDHGPLPRGKRWPYDSGIHVPLIVRWPGGIEPGTVSDRLVSTIDLGPTVLSVTELPIPGHLQGRPFLGPKAAEPRRYVFATRDRYDESYDMVRAVRDGRFKYMRHYYPGQPYLHWIPYRNRHPILEEYWRLHARDLLEGDQALLFNPRPAEELYDTVSDPWETRNLADCPDLADERIRLSRALDDWIADVGDMGQVPETEMVRNWYPNGRQPVTAAPLCIPICGENPGVRPATQGGRFEAPCLVQLYCATQGASIGYRFDTDPPEHWRLYTAPVRLPTGKATLRAKAIRIGYAESRVREAVFQVHHSGKA